MIFIRRVYFMPCLTSSHVYFARIINLGDIYGPLWTHNPLIYTYISEIITKNQKITKLKIFDQRRKKFISKGHPLPFMVMDAGVNDGGSSAIAAEAS